MADDTVYTVVDDVDTSPGSGSSSFYEGNGVNLSSPPANTDDTAYSVVEGVDYAQNGAGNSSFYEKNTVYDALTLAPDLLNQITAQANAAAASRAAADADAAAALNSQNAAAVSATNASTSASASSSSAAAAAASAASAASSATTATTEAGVATTQAGNAATSATNASNSATAASGSASSAATHDTNAGTSASAASTSATNAAASATAAAGSATAAASSASSAASAATTAVNTAITALVNGSPATLDTLKELADALGDDPNFATTVSTAISLKAPLASPGLTGTPTAPTPSHGDNSTKIATTAFVLANADVTSVFGRTGAVASQTGDYTFAQIGSKPTTVSGYGITDPIVFGNVATNFSAQQYFGPAVLTFGTTTSWSVSGSQKAKLTLTGNTTLAAVTGAVEGATYFLWVIQDATGSRTITWTTTGAGSFDFGAAGAPALSTAASKADLICFEAVTINGTLKLRCCGIQRGFS